MSGVSEDLRRVSVEIVGTVQGVGFRPFVARTALAKKVSGWIRNTGQGIRIEAQGRSSQLEKWLEQLKEQSPGRWDRSSLKVNTLPPLPPATKQEQVFQILGSQGSCAGNRSAIEADVAPCANCLAEVDTPLDRRGGYPFTSCVRCGPRISIATHAPFDRERTSYAAFPMCAACEREYSNPTNRRFHAQTVSCPSCGPRLEFQAKGWVNTEKDPLASATKALGQGLILALQATGGFQLWVDAQNAQAIAKLRERKRRPARPLAILFSSLRQLEDFCIVTEDERASLISPAAPIVLVRKRSDTLPESVAPGLDVLGAMLPSSMLQYLLLKKFGGPVVATSANLSEEPLCVSQEEVRLRLPEVVDAILSHDLVIQRRLDDSVMQVFRKKPMLLRRARGFTSEVATTVPAALKGSVLALGADLKSAIASQVNETVTLSPYLGRLDTADSEAAFSSEVEMTRDLLPTLTCVAVDHHPEYLSTREGERLGVPIVRVQHHEAHVLSCMAEHGLAPPFLGVAWDGTGYGLDGKLWGGELFEVGNELSFQRVATLRPFRLPGGEQAIREPRRAALGMLHALVSEGFSAISEQFTQSDFKILLRALDEKLNSPSCSSVGRLFDAVAAILEVRSHSLYEGHAAMELETLAGRTSELAELPAFGLRYSVVEKGEPVELDWGPWILGLLSLAREQRLRSREAIARSFHGALADGLVQMISQRGPSRILLSGGAFQNRLLLEFVVGRLEGLGHEVFWNQQIPINDGGIAVGQCVAAARRLKCV